MTEQEALQKMIAPGTRRPGKYREGVIQVWVTRHCDKACFGCTQGSNLKSGTKAHMFITPKQFEEAVVSLKGYWGVVGMFGGNPAIHPLFETLCAILREHVPFEQRGIWSNNPLGRGEVMRDTFNPRVSNLNVHLDRFAYEEFKRDWPECNPVGLTQDSRHSPPFVAMKDVVEDEGERWRLISDCDINKHWSAMVGVFRGQVRAWFCEVAGAQAMLHQDDPEYPDTGLPIRSDGLTEISWGDGKGMHARWWKLPITDFAAQIRKHCHECGVPLRGYGELAQTLDTLGTEQTTKAHESVYVPKRQGRRVELVTVVQQLNPGRITRSTDYIGNARK